MERKGTTPIYMLELEIKITAYSRNILDKKMRIGKNICNACLEVTKK